MPVDNKTIVIDKERTSPPARPISLMTPKQLEVEAQKERDMTMYEHGLETG